MNVKQGVDWLFFIYFLLGREILCGLEFYLDPGL